MVRDGPDSESNGLDRRNVIKSIASVPVGLPLVKWNRNKKINTKIKYTEDGKEVVDQEEVPKKWIKIKNKSTKLNKIITNEFSHKPGVETVGTVAGDSRVGGKRKLKIEVEIDYSKIPKESGFDPVKEIPSKKRGMPIEVVEAKEVESVSGCYNSSDPTYMPGGYITQNDPYSSSYGTTGWRVEVGGSKYMLTTNHVAGKFNDGNDELIGCTDLSGTAMYSGNYWIGDVAHSVPHIDLATITEGIPSYTDKIKGQNDTYEVGGYISKDGVKSRVADLWDGYRIMGVTSGKESGGLRKAEISGKGCRTYDYEGVRGGATTRGGDSGGPAFTLSDDKSEAFLIYMLSEGYSPTFDDAPCGFPVDKFVMGQGCSAYHIYDEGFVHIS